MKFRIVLTILVLLLFQVACNTDVAEPDPELIEPVEEVAAEDEAEVEEEAPEPAATPLPPTPEPQPTPPPEPTAESESAAEPAEEATSEPEPFPTEETTIKPGDQTIGEVTISGAEGLSLIGTFQVASGDGLHPTVLLLHMLGSDRSVWDEFASTLNENGYNTLALDMRGHGATGGSQDWPLAEQDLMLVYQYLIERPDVDETRIAIIGGSIGSNMALITGSNIPDIKTVVLLSPGLDYRGVLTEPAMEAYGNRPVLIIASNEDTYSADSSRTLAEQFVNEASQLHLYDGAGHGTNMFAGAEDLTQRLLDWLQSNL